MKFWSKLQSHQIAALLKGLVGVFEFLTGSLVVLLSKATITGVLTGLFSAEQLEDPNDPVVLWVQHFLGLVLPIKVVVGCALLVLGILKIVGAIGVFRQKAWGFMILIVMVGSPIPFELVEVVKHPTLITLGLLLANIGILSLLAAKYPR